MKINWQTISQQTFMDEFWNKKPIVLKNAIVDFEDPIDANDLAGLAMEEVVESRIVSKRADSWQVQHGPFKDYENLPDDHWSLLVQGVDRWVPEVSVLRTLVSFLPSWQIDDVMLSFSTIGGGVGPHLDQYNVFILQGQGERRWKIGSVDHSLVQQEVTEDLLQVDSFNAVIDEVLESGDLLYIPPFAPHCGDTIQDAMSYSIGFRAPSQTELLTSFADYIYEHELGKSRAVVNSTQQNINQTSAIPSDHIEQLKSFMLATLNNGQFDHFAHQFLTEPTRELDIAPSEHEWTEPLLMQLIQSETTQITKVLGLQTSYYLLNDELHFFCNGIFFKLLANQLNFIEKLHNDDILNEEILKNNLNQLENITLLTTLINTGYWYING